MKMSDGKTGRKVKRAQSYGQRVQAQKQLNALKNQGPPLGGAPPIPEGKMSALLPQPDFGGDDDEMEVPPDFRMEPQEPPPPIQGVGAGYEVNQAQARGDIGAVSMAEAGRQGFTGKTKKGPLSQETQELLSKAELAEQPEEGETPLKDSLAEADEEIASDVSPAVAFDFERIASLRNEMMSKERRELIESKLDPLDVTDLLVSREIQQTIEVIPNKLAYTLRTFTEREHIWILKHLYNYPGSDQYVEELYNMFKVTCCFVGMNGKLVPDHRKNPGKADEEVDEKLFEKKFGIVSGMPSQLVADLGVQCNWFNDRVNQLFSVKNLKNG